MFDGLDPSIVALFVAPRDLMAWVDRIRPHLAKMAAGSHGRYEMSDLFAGLAKGEMLLWVAIQGADVRCVLLGQIINYPRARVMRLTGLVGSQPRRWRHLLRAVENQAKVEFGCAMMESVHQPRHKVFLPGYETTHWMSEKSL